MAGRATALKRVASQAGALIQLGRTSMRAVLEQGQRNVGPGQFIVAAATVVCRVTGRASHAIEGGVPAVDIVPPSLCVRGRPRHFMAGNTLVTRLGIRRDTRMAGVAPGVRRGRLFPMLDAETRVVRGRTHVTIVIRRNSALHAVAMTETAVRHLELHAQTPSRFVASDTIEHCWHGEPTERGARDAYGDAPMTGQAIQPLLWLRLQMNLV